MRFPPTHRFAEVARGVGTSMISAAFIAGAIRPDNVTLISAIMLAIMGLALWYLGALPESTDDEDSS